MGWLFDSKSSLKNEEFAGGKVVSRDNAAIIEISLDDQMFDQDGIATFSLKENGIKITLRKKGEVALGTGPCASTDGIADSSSQKEEPPREGLNVDVGNVVSNPVKEATETAKSTGAMDGQKKQLH